MKLKGNVDNLAYETKYSAGFDLRASESLLLIPSFSLQVLGEFVNLMQNNGSYEALRQKFLEYLTEYQAYSNVYPVGTGVYIEEASPDEKLVVVPRSGLAAKHGVTVLNSPGLIDADYPGEIKVILINLGIEPFRIQEGDRIAQAVLTTYKTVSNLEVRENVRKGGLGSTGVK